MELQRPEPLDNFIIDPHDTADIVVVDAMCDTTTGTYNITPHIYGDPATTTIPTTDIEVIECVAGDLL